LAKITQFAHSFDENRPDEAGFRSMDEPPCNPRLKSGAGAGKACIFGSKKKPVV
jgi:hypothetical protein